MDLEIELPRIYERYVPRFDKFFPTDAAWILDFDSTLTKEERDKLQNFAGCTTRALGNVSHFPQLQRLRYVECFSCEHMTHRCDCGACPVCVHVHESAKYCLKCKPDKFESKESEICMVCGFREIGCPDCGDCPSCNDAKACGRCKSCCKCRICSSCDSHSDRLDMCENCDECESCCTCDHCENCGEGIAQACSHCNRCETCCECAKCEKCGEPSESTCDNCDKCSECCACPYCESCETHVSRNYYCYTCERCNDCECRCSQGGETIHHPCHPIFAQTLYERKLFNCTRLAGVEVEYNRSEDFEPIRDWANTWEASVHEDSSCGWECVTRPAAGDHLASQLGDLFSALKDANAESDTNCGIHVHVDARDLYWEDMYRLVTVYARVEPILYALAGQGRINKFDGTNYCRPNGKNLENGIHRGLVTGKRKHELLTAIYGVNGEQKARYKPEKKDGARYVGLNLCPWVAGRLHKHSGSSRSMCRADTTVEFRMHRDSLDAKRVIGWAKLCTRLVDWASKATDKDVENLPRSPLRMLCVIAPDLAPWILSRFKEWRKTFKSEYRRIRYRNFSYEISDPVQYGPTLRRIEEEAA
jgi:hypothetical protein